MNGTKNRSAHEMARLFSLARAFKQEPTPFKETVTATVRLAKRKPPDANAIQQRHEKALRINFERFIHDVSYAPDKVLSDCEFVCKENPWLNQEVSDKVWERIRKKSGLPNHARGPIGLMIVLFQDSADRKRSAPPKPARDLERPLKTLSARLNAFLADEAALNFVLNETKHPMTAAMLRSTSLFQKLYESIKTLDELSLRLTARGLRTRTKKLASSPLVLVRFLNELLFRLSNRRISRSKTSKDFEWIDEVCCLVTSYGTGQVQRAIQLTIQRHIAGLEKAPKRGRSRSS